MAGNSFDKTKRELLHSLQNGVDFSPKGSIDYPVRDVVNFLNNCPNYVTTSSCSGRIAAFESGSLSKGIRWLVVKHEIVTREDILMAVQSNTEISDALIMLKCEPLILHIHCRDVESARALHHIAFSSGYRESGLSIGAKKVMVAIRTTAFGLEMPIARGNKLLIDEAMLNLAIFESNSRLLKNFARIDKLLLAMKAEFLFPVLSLVTGFGNKLIARYGHSVWDMMNKKGNISQDQVECYGILGGSGSTNSALYGVDSDNLENSSRKLPIDCFSINDSTGLGSVTHLTMPSHNPIENATDNSLSIVHGVVIPWTVNSRNMDADTVANKILLIVSGGRSSPSRAYPCCRVFDTSLHGVDHGVTPDSSMMPPYDVGAEITVSQCGDLPENRWGHSLTRLSFDSLSCGVYLLTGGRNEFGLLHGMYLLTLVCVEESGSWRVTATWHNLIRDENQYFTQATPNASVADTIYPMKELSPRMFHCACGLSSYLSANFTLSDRIIDYDKNWGINQDNIEHDAVLLQGGLTDLNNVEISGDFIVVYPFLGVWMYLSQYQLARNNISDAYQHDVNDRVATAAVTAAVDDNVGVSANLFLPPVKRFGHTITYIGGKCWLLTGGASYDADCVENIEELASSNTTTTLLLEIQLCETGLFAGHLRALPIRCDATMTVEGNSVLPCDRCRVHHQAIFNERHQHLLLLGGGSQCLSFGTHYCESVTVHCGIEGSADAINTPPNASIVESMNSATAGTTTAKQQNEVPHSTQASVLLVLPAHVKAIKTKLESLQMLDKKCRITRVDATIGDIILVQHNDPLDASTVLVSRQIIITAVDQFDARMCVPIVAACVDALLNSTINTLKDSIPSQLMHCCSDNHLYLGHQIVRENKLHVVSSFRKAVEYLHEAIRLFHLPENAAQAIPSKFEMVGDVVMIPEDALNRCGWEHFTNSSSDTLTNHADTEASISPKHYEFWRGLANCFGATRIAKKAIIDSGEMRESKVRLLYPVQGRPTQTGPGSVGWVTVNENGIKYSFDITRVMFCSGNVTERMRMGRQACRDQIIVDLYCGVGYYTIPFLVHGHAGHVHACEWNPNSILALRNNLQMAGVENRCTVHPGDNNISSSQLHGIADRISCGLLPSSVKGWPLAVNCLKKDGGIIHVHENVLETSLAEWTASTCESFQKLFDEVGKPMDVVCEHTEIVKSYAPRVVHVVVDLRCTPRIC